MATRRDGSPVLVTSTGSVSPLARLPLAENDLQEGFHLRDFVFHNPDCLPVRQIDATYAPLIPIGVEVQTDAGPIDCLFISPTGLLTIVETKLWRNPQARREVVGQILDYAKEVAQWSYSDFDEICRGKTGLRLWEHVQQNISDVATIRDEAEFIDQTSRALEDGKFLLLVVGDGIHEGVERMAAYLQAAPQLLFSLHLVELQVYDLSGGERLVVPQLIARTEEIPRAVVHVRKAKEVDGVHVDVTLPSSRQHSSKSKNRLSEAEFFNQLEEIKPELVEDAKRFIDQIQEDPELYIDWHTASFTVKLNDPVESRLVYSLLNATTLGKVQVWAIRDQMQRAGLPEKFADEYLQHTAAIVGTSANSGAWSQTISLKKLAEHQSLLLTEMRRVAKRVREFRTSGEK